MDFSWLLALCYTVYGVVGIVHIRKPTLNEARRQSSGPKVDKLVPGSGVGSGYGLSPSNVLQLSEVTDILRIVYSEMDTLRFDNCCQPKLLRLSNIDPSFFPVRGASSNLRFAYCDMLTDGGGWMGILLRKKSKDIFIRRNYHTYRNGFGKLGRGYWLGLENIHYFTNQPGGTELLVEMVKDGVKYVAYYDSFLVESSATNYILRVSGFVANKSNVSDSLSANNGMKFYHDKNEVKRAEIGRQYGPHSLYCNAFYGYWWFGTTGNETCTLVAFNRDYDHVHYNPFHYDPVPNGYIWVVNGKRIGFDMVQMKIRPKRWECGSISYPSSVIRRAFYSQVDASLNPFNLE